MKGAFIIGSGFVGCLALAGCTRHDVPVPDSAIRLSATTTRAAVATVVDLYGGFRVFAASGDIASTGAWYPGIDGTNDHVFSDGGWDFETPVPWPVDEAKYPMNFYAWYPADETRGPVLTANDPAADPARLQGTFTVAPTADGQIDFLTAKTHTEIEPPRGNLSITFGHALSKIDIGIVSGRGTTPVIQAMGVAFVGGSRTYDFIAGDWASAQPADRFQWYPYLGTLDFRTGGSASPAPLWAPGTADTEGRLSRPYTEAEGAHLMLMPQTGSPWKPAVGAAPVTDAALIYVLYRMSTDEPSDEVGYARASDRPEYAAGQYDGPLYVLAGFPLSQEATFTWAPGKGYTYHIGLGTLRSGNGYLLSDYYYDENGARTTIPVRQGRRTGEKLKDGTIRVSLSVTDWDDPPANRHPGSDGIITLVTAVEGQGAPPRGQPTDLGLFCTYTGNRPWTADDPMGKMFDRRLVRSGAAGHYNEWTYADGVDERWEIDDPATNPAATAADRYTFFACAPYASGDNGLRVLDPTAEVAS